MNMCMSKLKAPTSAVSNKIVASDIYEEILNLWTPDKSSYSVNDQLKVVSNVDLYKQQSLNEKNNMEFLQGENSSIFELTLNDGQTLILKHEIRKGHSIREEAELQQYASAEHSPRVFAFNDKSILMEKCAPVSMPKHKTFGMMEKGIKLHSLREDVYEFNSISRALTALPLLKTTTLLYDDKGMYSEDVHAGNFLKRGSTLVHIDFDEIYFKDCDAYKAFARQTSPERPLDSCIGQRRVKEDRPEDPPCYFWWADSFFKEKDERTWNRAQWLAHIQQMKLRYNQLHGKITAFLNQKMETRVQSIRARVHRIRVRIQIKVKLVF